MTGEKPVKWPKAVFAFVLGCCGYVFLGITHSPLRAEEADTQQADMIPQDEVIVRGEGLAENLPITYSLRITKNPERIKLKGNMSSEEDYKTLIGMVKANFPSTSVVDRVKINEDVSNADVKIGGLGFALKLLGYLESGQAYVDNNGISLEGSASTAVVLTEVKNLIENDKPTGVPLKNIRIAPPEKSWHASVTPDRTIKITGIVPSKDSQKAISDYANQKFSNFDIDDGAVINNQLPDRWTQAAQKSIDLLFLLDMGSVEITEQTIHLKGNATSDTALKSIDAIANDLPSGFALKSEVTAPAPPHAGIAAMPLAAGTAMPR